MIDWKIIDKSINATLTDSEKNQLQGWLEESNEHQQLYEKIRKKNKLYPEENQYQHWQEAFELNLRRRERKERQHKLLKWGSAAAAVLLLLIGGVEWYLWQQPTVQQQQPYAAYQEPDRSKVRLLTATGTVVDLSQNTQQDTLTIDGVKVAKAQKTLAYPANASSSSTGKTVVNKVEVPRGAEFCLALSDGTRVWLNSDSRLSYPVAFTSECREVELEGEAYFEVTRNESRPFIVHAAGMSITVLGTEFNVNTRKPEYVQTTLVKGKVEIGSQSAPSVLMKPGDMALTNVQNGKTVITPVNVRKYTAWRYGEYFFEDTTIEEILNELALWYDVGIVYQSDLLRKEKFSGCLPRSESIMAMLNKIGQTTYVHFSVQQNRIVVSY